jgi:hypothetical protein
MREMTWISDLAAWREATHSNHITISLYLTQNSSRHIFLRHYLLPGIISLYPLKEHWGKSIILSLLVILVPEDKK